MDILSYTLGKKAGGGSAPVLQDKEVTITENGETEITPDSGYDGLSSVEVTTDVPVGGKYAPRYVSFYNYRGTELNYETANLDTSNITSMNYMFYNLTSLTSIDVSGFVTSQATSMEYMFSGCSQLTSLDLSAFDITSCKNMASFLDYCTRLRFLDIRNMVFSTKTNFRSYNMFGAYANNGIPNDCEIIVKDDDEKAWINSNFSRLTNVKTVAEYEGN